MRVVLRGLLNRLTALALVLSLGGIIILVVHKPPPCQPALTITSPVAGAMVGLNQVVTGHASCLAAGQHPWLILQPVASSGSGYFPQDELSVAANSWSTTATYGRAAPAADNGRRFILLAVIADDKADRRFLDWLAGGAASGNYNALADLTGATVLDQVTVVRGP